MFLFVFNFNLKYNLLKNRNITVYLLFEKTYFV